MHLAFQDDSDNITRFLMLAREPIIPGIDKPFKVSNIAHLLSIERKNVIT